MNSDASSIRKRLEKHPHIMTRLSVMLDVAENVSGSYDLADDAEDKLFIEVRNLGKELLQNWAENQILEKSEQAIKKDVMTRHSKKNCAGIQD